MTFVEFVEAVCRVADRVIPDTPPTIISEKPTPKAGGAMGLSIPIPKDSTNKLTVPSAVGTPMASTPLVSGTPFA